jgi:hypothetical protein
MPEQEMERVCATIKDQNLRLTLAFGIGIHHAGKRFGPSLRLRYFMSRLPLTRLLAVMSCMVDSAAIYIYCVVVKFRSTTICPLPRQLLHYRGAALSTNFVHSCTLYSRKNRKSSL